MRKKRRVFLATTSIAIAVMCGPIASADEPVDANADAASRALFEEGRRLMQANDFPAACAKFEEGQRILPGVGLKFNLADCHEKVGRVASAWAEFLDAAGMAKAVGQTEREEVARARAANLEKRVPHVRIFVRDQDKTDGLEVKRDGALVGAAQWGIAIPIDPGVHEVAASAPNHKSATMSFTVREGQDESVAVPALDLLPTTPIDQGQVPVLPPPSTRGNTQRLIGVITGGVGVVGLAVGAFFGLSAKSKKDDASPHCFANDQCDAQGLIFRDQAIDKAHVSTGAFITGGVLLVGGAVLFLTAPRGAASSSSTRASAIHRDGITFTF